MRFIALIFPSLLLFVSNAFGAEDIVDRLRLKSVEKAAEDFIQSVPPQSSVAAWVKEHGPIYGNYCGVAHGEAAFDSPCLGKMDCVCKAHDFGHALRKHLLVDTALLEGVLGKDAILRDQSVNYQNFLKNITIKLFAAKLKGVDVAESLKAAHAIYAKDPQKAQKLLDKVIDENEAVRKKIEEINIERIKFEEMRFESQQISENVPKKRSVSTQPFNIIAGLFSINYEQALSSVFSLRLGANFLGEGLITNTYLGYGNFNNDFSVFFSLGVKSFVTGHTLRGGLYLEPFADIGYENVAIKRKPELPNVKDFAIVPALMIGIEKVFSVGIQVDLGIGAGYHIGIPISENVGGIDTNFFVPKFRASLGYAW